MRAWVGIASLLVVGCGARTGLGIDDGGAPIADAGPPRPGDAGPRRRDAGPPRPRDAGPREDAFVPPDPDAGPPLPPERDPTGLWITDVESPANSTVFALHRRAGGELMGYVFGGSPVRLITGTRSEIDGHLEIGFETTDPRRSSTQMRTGVVDGDVITLDPIEGSTVNHLVRFTGVVTERRWVLVRSAAGTPRHRYDLAAAFGDGTPEAFYGGSLVARDECSPICSGRVTAWREDAAGPVVSLESGPCSVYTLSIATGRALWEMTDCMGGSFTGTYEAVQVPGTDGRDVLGVLAALGAIADDLERRDRFGLPYDRVSDAYAHRGERAMDLLHRWNEEISEHGPIDVELTHLSSISTDPPPGFVPAPEELWTGQTVSFHDRRMGAAGEVYFDDVTPGGDDAMAFLSDVDPGTPDGFWRLVGREGR